MLHYQKSQTQRSLKKTNSDFEYSPDGVLITLKIFTGFADFIGVEKCKLIPGFPAKASTLAVFNRMLDDLHAKARNTFVITKVSLTGLTSKKSE